MRIDQAYHYLTHHIVPGPQNLSYFLPLFLLPVALLIPRTILSRWQSISLFLPVILFAELSAWNAIGGVDVISVDVLLWSLYLLALRDPWEDFVYMSTLPEDEHKSIKRQLSAIQSNGSIDPALITSTTQTAEQFSEDTVPGIKYPASFFSRLPWVGSLLVSIRLNNWKIGIPSHDVLQPPGQAFASRRQFVLRTLLCFCRGYLILDFTSAYTNYDAYFTDASVPITSSLPFAHSQFIPSQVFRSMVIGAQAWALIGQMFYLPCLLPVGLNALGLLGNDWSPHNWAPYFGSPVSIFLHGVRGFWGQYWHQMMRASCSGPGYAIADALNLTSDGLPRYAVISLVAFGLSGIVHMGLVPPEPLHATVHVNTVRLYLAGFFWIQPIGMMIEILVSRIFKRTQSLERGQQPQAGVFHMLLTGVWVICWFSISLPLLGEAARQLGYWRSSLVPISIWKALRGQNAISWPFLKGQAL